MPSAARRVLVGSHVRFLELAQQIVAAFHRGIERFPGALRAPEGLLQLLLDHVADLYEGAEAQSLRVLGGWIERDLFDGRVGPRVLVVKPLRARQLVSGERNRQVAGVLVPPRLRFRPRQEGEKLGSALVLGPRAAL